MAFLASWQDPRLAFDLERELADVKLFQGAYQFAELFHGWWPQLLIVNEVRRVDPKAVTFRISPDGTVW